MTNNGKDIKQTRNSTRRIHLVRNSEEFNLHKIVWCDGGFRLADIGTNNVRRDKLNP